MVLHRWIVGLLSAFLGMVFLMIFLNNRPFFGKASLEPTSFTDIHWIAKQELGPTTRSCPALEMR